jgi:hypothetical protein
MPDVIEEAESITVTPGIELIAWTRGTGISGVFHCTGVHLLSRSTASLPVLPITTPAAAAQALTKLIRPQA